MTLCICCGKPSCDPHHPQPQSQNGTAEGTVPVCRACHSFYHAICGQRLAKTVKARVANFGVWMCNFPGCTLTKPKQGPDPARMAPTFLIAEAKHFKHFGQYRDLSEGCLSTLGKVKEYPPREPRQIPLDG